MFNISASGLFQAVVFMGIVGVFLFCHFLRVFLNLHEMFVIRQAMACQKAGQRSFAMWAIILNTCRFVRARVRASERGNFNGISLQGDQAVPDFSRN